MQVSIDSPRGQLLGWLLYFADVATEFAAHAEITEPGTTTQRALREAAQGLAEALANARHDRLRKRAKAAAARRGDAAASTAR